MYFGCQTKNSFSPMIQSARVADPSDEVELQQSKLRSKTSEFTTGPGARHQVFCFKCFLYHLSGWLDCVDMRSAMYGRTVFSRCHRRSRAVKARGLLQRPPGGGNEMPRIGWSVLRNHDAIMP